MKPLFHLGFRPFFLLSALSAFILITLWLAIFLGALTHPSPFAPVFWHAHEMVYGYSLAVIAGFVLTASQNWTGIRGVHGRSLLLLCLLWFIARILILISPHTPILNAVVDLSFYPVCSWLLFPYLRPSDMKTERVFFLFFALYFVGNLLMHLDVLAIYPGQSMRGAYLGLATTLIMIIFMGGRVIPFFTESEKSKSQPQVNERLEPVVHIASALFLIAMVLAPQSLWTGIISLITGLLHAVRLFGWYVRRIRRIAILWILHAAYAWLVLGFILFAFFSWGYLPSGPAIHALALGGLGGITYGMMSRVALGHTGRRLKPVQMIVWGYALIQLGAVLRVFGPLFAPHLHPTWILLSGISWIGAFALFLIVYTPILLRPRADGRPG